LAHASLAAKPTDNRHLCPQGLLTDGIGENIIRAGAIKEGPESRLWRRGPRGDRWQHRKSKDGGHAAFSLQLPESPMWTVHNATNCKQVQFSSVQFTVVCCLRSN
jgi:hypothetical protein